ncbi:sensor histidine kinase [Sulfuriroseicoccus oceanibius]|uniref:histidine kinase n=1 Tax=Sulfuriroseicoccus oceanibius TaxID=2707525 RepID=A0A6B3L7Z7_9BACT|nr:HAMP domain-containing sensor histidine kinase [Sulfuriroseicoccus oceanibius]QQL45272.1 HAMP domain-containing histidine kinase [Sulfuriroseicoccus oceanibius]
MTTLTDTSTETYIPAPSPALGTGEVHAYYESLLKGLTQRVDNYSSLIQGYGSLALMDDNVDPELATNIERMKQAGEETSRLMGRLLTLVNCPRAVRQEVHPNTFFPTLERGIRQLGDSYGTAIAISIAPGLPAINADPSRIWECLAELLRNACEASQGMSDKAVAFDVVQAKDSRGRRLDEVHAIVTNSGADIPEDVIRDVFLPFHSTKSSQAPDHFGLGLPVAAALAQSMGGHIDLMSANSTTKARLRLKTCRPHM